MINPFFAMDIANGIFRDPDYGYYIAHGRDAREWIVENGVQVQYDFELRIMAGNNGIGDEDGMDEYAHYGYHNEADALADMAASGIKFSKTVFTLFK